MSGNQETAPLLPAYPGFRVTMDHQFPETRDQNFKPRLKQIPKLAGMSARYLLFYAKSKIRKKKPFIDGIQTLGLKQIYGVPAGGIGAGTIGRGFRGEFCRYQLLPGIYQHHVVPQNQFIVTVRLRGETVYQQVLSPHPAPGRKLRSWNWQFEASRAEYLGLYPRSWTSYRLKEIGVTLVCQQVSPVIPHNYKDSSIPACVFVWTIHNESDEDYDVSLTFTFKNGTGGRADRRGQRHNQPFHTEDGIGAGVMLHMALRGIPCVLGIAASKQTDNDVSWLTAFNARGDGSDLWNPLKATGQLTRDLDNSPKTRGGEEIGAAVCVSTRISSKHSGRCVFTLTWDMPNVQFRSSPSLSYSRRYTQWFGADGDACPRLTSYSLQEWERWDREIQVWQEPTLADESLPDWYKSAIFNELYFISDGGSLWINADSDKSLDSGDPRADYGRFAYLEGHEYRMFNTYDVHYYASFALIQLWPQLQLSLQYDMVDAINTEDARRIRFLMKGDIGLRKTANCVPHDIGDPEEAPWERLNSYPVHNTADWRDLNLKFVLQVYRDYVFTADETYLHRMWATVKILMKKAETWDADADGLIENSGCADQTYDTWIMKGPSAYCGGLWLAALYVTIQMASRLGEESVSEYYTPRLEAAKAAYHEKLWTGSYYRFDSSGGRHADSIMSDQLCGQWYLLATGHARDVLPEANVHAALATIYKFNVCGFCNGELGAANSMRPTGKRDTYAIQSEEVWVGVTYALAATMIYEGMRAEGLATAESMYRAVYERLGMGYQTPEAVFPQKHYRSIGYMRPLSIWSIHHALQQ